jgi:hypothetical protein
LAQHTQSFLERKQLPYHPIPIGGPYTNMCGFSLKKIQSSRIIGEYIQSVKESQKIYSQRWGDSPLWGEVVYHLLDASIQIDRSLKYFHGSHNRWINSS